MLLHGVGCGCGSGGGSMVVVRELMLSLLLLLKLLLVLLTGLLLSANTRAQRGGAHATRTGGRLSVGLTVLGVTVTVTLFAVLAVGAVGLDVFGQVI